MVNLGHLATLGPTLTFSLFNFWAEIAQKTSKWASIILEYIQHQKSLSLLPTIRRLDFDCMISWFNSVICLSLILSLLCLSVIYLYNISKPLWVPNKTGFNQSINNIMKNNRKCVYSQNAIFRFFEKFQRPRFLR